MAAWSIANGRMVRVSGGLSGPGGLTKAGGGRLELLGNDSFAAPLIVSAGELVKQGSGAQSSTTISGNAVLRVFHSGGFGSGGLSITAANNSTGRLEISGGIAVLSGKTTTINSRNSNTNAIVSHGDNTIGGAINISTGGGLCALSSEAGTLTVAGTLGSIATGSRNFTLRGSGSGILTGAVTNGSGTVGLIKSGSGGWTLAGSHGFGGTVLVQEGTLAVNTALPSQAVTVAAGALLTGSGELGGNVAVNGRHSPGIGVGAQTVSGDLAYAAGAALVWEIGGHDGPADALVANAVSFDPAATVEIVANPAGGAVDYADPFWRQPRQWTILTANTIGGKPLVGAVSNDTTGRPAAPFGGWEIVSSSTSIMLQWTPADPFDGWLYGFFGDAWDAPATAGTNRDPDADGWTNRDEWIAGTDPTDPSSRFTVAADGLGISFTRRAGRTYEVFTATDPGGVWVHHADVPDGEGRIAVPPPADPGPRRFYRVVIRFVP